MHAHQLEHGLLDVLRAREEQARGHRRAYLASVADTDSMLFWLATAARSARKQAGRLAVHVAASASVTESTITRFEKATAWPKNTDRVIEAYADDLEIQSFQLWQEALRLWRHHLEHPDEAVEALERAGQQAVRDLAGEDGTAPQAKPAPARRRRATG